MPRPSTLRSSPITTALVVVDPRSMPMKHLMSVPRRALLLDHLEVALEPVLDVGRGEVARIYQVRFDERRGLPGALLDFAQDQQLSRGEAVAALDRIDQQSVGLVLVEVFADHVDPLREIQVGVDADAIL